MPVKTLMPGDETATATLSLNRWHALITILQVLAGTVENPVHRVLVESICKELMDQVGTEEEDRDDS